MIELKAVDDRPIRQFGLRLFYETNQLTSFEETSQYCADAIYDIFRDVNGESTFALVRIFRLCKTYELPGDNRNRSEQGDQWLALMGTAGDEPAWCDRRRSQSHQLVHVDSGLTGMFKECMHQLNGHVVPIGGRTHVEVGQASMMKYFYVADAMASPAIPDKAQFVEPYNIQSVIAFGSSFLSGSFYLCLCFAKTYLGQDKARDFAMMTPHLSTILAAQDYVGNLWA